MHKSGMHDGQAMFDVTLQVAHGRISALYADGGPRRMSTAGSMSAGRSRIRRALGLRLLALGAALIREEPLLAKRRPATRG